MTRDVAGRSADESPPNLRQKGPVTRRQLVSTGQDIQQNCQRRRGPRLRASRSCAGSPLPSLSASASGAAPAPRASIHAPSSSPDRPLRSRTRRPNAAIVRVPAGQPIRWRRRLTRLGLRTSPPPTWRPNARDAGERAPRSGWPRIKRWVPAHTQIDVGVSICRSETSSRSVPEVVRGAPDHAHHEADCPSSARTRKLAPAISPVFRTRRTDAVVLQRSPDAAVGARLPRVARQHPDADEGSPDLRERRLPRQTRS